MPKLAKKRFAYETRDGEGAFEVTVKVNQAGYFYCDIDDIPEFIRKRTNLTTDYMDQVMAFTLSGFLASIESIIRSFEELDVEETKEKIILYRVFIQGDLTPELDLSDGGCRRHDDLGREVNLGFGTKWHVCYRHKMAGEVRYTHENGAEFQPYQMEELAWTAEREAWFERLDARLIELITQVDVFLKSPGPEALLEVIDSGQLLLGASKGDQ